MTRPARSGTSLPPLPPFVALWLDAWALTILGGGACALFCLGVDSLPFFFIAAPTGAVLGAALGLPLGLIIATVIHFTADPPTNVGHFVRNVALTGAGIGLATTAVVVPLAFPDLEVPLETAAITNALFAATAIALIGRRLGRSLAHAHLRRHGIAPPTPRWRGPTRCGCRVRALSHLGRGLAIAVLIGLLTGCSGSPDTPSNSLMSWLTAAQVGSTSKADGHLCERLRNRPTSGERANMNTLINHASTFGGEDTKASPDLVRVSLSVVVAPSAPGAPGVPWMATMVKEHGSWRVCGLAPS